MKEYNETEAIDRMMAAIPEQLRDEDAVCEVLDLIYDYYEENGDLDIGGDDDADDDVDAMTVFVAKYLRKNAPSVSFDDTHIAAMIRAELEYEESLL